MLKLSKDQILTFENARARESARCIREAIMRHHPEFDTGDAPDGLNDRANEIADFCARFLILQAGNMQKITLAHCRFGITTPEYHMTIPLRRKGFSEDERVTAYLYALETKKKRLVLRQSF